MRNISCFVLLIIKLYHWINCEGRITWLYVHREHRLYFPLVYIVSCMHIALSCGNPILFYVAWILYIVYEQKRSRSCNTVSKKGLKCPLCREDQKPRLIYIYNLNFLWKYQQKTIYFVIFFIHNVCLYYNIVFRTEYTSNTMISWLKKRNWHSYFFLEAASSGIAFIPAGIFVQVAVFAIAICVF